MRTRYGMIALALASLFPLASSFAADTKLVKAVSDHFELYTTDNDAAAKAALQHFETVRGYLLKTLHSQDPFTAPVRIVGFKSAGEYTPYIPRTGDLASKAFTESKGDSVTLVMSSLKKEAYQFGVREYAMLLLDKVAPKMPYWLKMGMSELYSTLYEDNGLMRLGAEPARDFRATVSPDFDMAVMFALKGGVSRNKGAADFYSESTAANVTKTGSTMANMEATTTVDYPVVLWQLTHMLMFKKEYSPKFGPFVAAVREENTDAVIGQVYGQSLAGLKQDLVLYIKLPSHAVAGIKFDLDTPVTPQVSQLNAAESALVLADLKAAK